MTPLVHNYSHKAGKTYLWDTSDSEELYHNNIKDPVKKQCLVDLGYVDNPITYRFNQHGFRTEEFDKSVDVACFGCSFTMGTGVHDTDTWPAQLKKLAGMSVANLGHAGSSNDTAFRFASHYLTMLRPRWAVWLQTDAHRLEIMDDHTSTSINLLAHGVDRIYPHNKFLQTWFSSESNQQLNLLKNTLAFERLCQSQGIVPVVLGRDKIVADGRARDLLHPGADAYKDLAKQIVSLLG